LAEAAAMRKRCSVRLHSAALTKDFWLYINKLAANSCSRNELACLAEAVTTIGFCQVA
jgi:hypothetical protein